MIGHKICFYGEMWLIIPKLSLLPLLIWSTEARELKRAGEFIRIKMVCSFGKGI